MVLRNGEKFSCASCIKGHRSSSCQHIDRPLIAVKKKGRPVTQCAHCRELRKTKKLHIKCICAENAIAAYDGFAYSPSGLASSSSKVQNLLNPCDCIRSSHCRCCELICDSPSTRYCRPTKNAATSLILEVAEPLKGKKRTTLPSPAIEEKGSFCACGCRSTSTNPTDSPLSILGLLNPCKCCMDGKKCGCNHLKKRRPDTPGSLYFSRSPHLLESKNSTCCSDTTTIESSSNQLALKSNASGASTCCSELPNVHDDAVEVPTLSTTDVLPSSCCQALPEEPKTRQIAACCSSEIPQSLAEQKHSPLHTSKGSCCSSDLIPSFEGINSVGPKKTLSVQGQTSCCSVGGKCVSCKGGCRCNVQSEPSSNASNSVARKEFIDQDGVKSCGCGCYLSTVECTDCIQDSCTEFLFRPTE